MSNCGRPYIFCLKYNTRQNTAFTFVAVVVTIIVQGPYGPFMLYQTLARFVYFICVLPIFFFIFFCDSGFCCCRYCQFTIIIAVPVALNDSRFLLSFYTFLFLLFLMESKASLCVTFTKPLFTWSNSKKYAIIILNDILLVESREELNLYPVVSGEFPHKS